MRFAYRGDHRETTHLGASPHFDTSTHSQQCLQKKENVVSLQCTFCNHQKIGTPQPTKKSRRGAHVKIPSPPTPGLKKEILQGVSPPPRWRQWWRSWTPRAAPRTSRRARVIRAGPGGDGIGTRAFHMAVGQKEVPQMEAWQVENLDQNLWFAGVFILAHTHLIKTESQGY